MRDVTPDLVSLSGAAFSTLNTAADALPPLEPGEQFASGLLTRLSGTNRRALMEALRVLEFVDDADRVTGAFSEYLASPERRPAILRDRLLSLVPWAIPLLEESNGPRLLDELVQYGASALLAPRVARWLLDAAAFAGLRDARARVQLPWRARQARLPFAFPEGPPLAPPSLAHLDPALLTWLQRLPPSGASWSPEEKARWLRTLDALLQGIYPAAGGNSL